MHSLRAGAEIYHAGSVGVDGDFLLRQLQDAGVSTAFVTVLEDERTGNAIIQNDKDGDNCILLYGGANQAITASQVDFVLEHFQTGDYLVLQNEINEIPHIMEEAHKRGMKIVLNPSPMNEKIMEFPLEYVDYFLLNEIEAGQILNQEIESDFDGEKLARMLLERFPSSATVLTMGGRGSIYMDREQIVRQPVYQVQAVDTAAAGDTFTGFFISGILRGMAVEEAMDLASRATAVAVTRQGAAPSIPTCQEVEKFWEKNL